MLLAFLTVFFTILAPIVAQGQDTTTTTPSTTVQIPSTTASTAATTPSTTLQTLAATSTDPESTPTLQTSTAASTAPESTPKLETSAAASTAPESTPKLETSAAASTAPESTPKLETSTAASTAPESTPKLETSAAASTAPESTATLQTSAAASTAPESTATVQTSAAASTAPESTTTVQTSAAASTAPESTTTLQTSAKTTTKRAVRTCLCSDPMVGVNIESSGGSEVAVIQIGDFSQCCTACTQNTLCAAFTIWQNRCYLKRSADRFGRANDVISGRVTCTGGGCSCGPRMENVTIQAGMDLQVISDTTDFGMCCEACTAHPQCKAFTIWTFTVSKCYLKSGAEPKGMGANVFSSVMDCGETAAACRCSDQMNGVNIESASGSDLAVLQNAGSFR